MKLIFVSNLSWNLFNFRLGFMTQLKKMGHNVLFCAPADKYTDELIAKGFEFIPVKIEREGTSFVKDLLLILKLFFIYKKNKPDFVLHFTIKPNLYGSLAAKLAGTRCINTISGLGYIFISGKHYRLVKFLYQLACGIAEKTFFHNNSDLSFFVANNIVKKEKASLVAGSGVDTDYFYASRLEFNSNEKTFKFLFLGRLLKDKGLLELIDAIKEVKRNYPDVRLYMVGPIDKGNPSRISASLVHDWECQGLTKYFGEAVDVRRFIEETDCLVLPSHKVGAPRAVLEALSMQKPVITTDIAGCSQMVEHGVNGYLVPEKNPKKLAEAMLSMIALPEKKRAEMGINGRKKIIDKFEEKTVICVYLSALGL